MSFVEASALSANRIRIKRCSPTIQMTRSIDSFAIYRIMRCIRVLKTHTHQTSSEAFCETPRNFVICKDGGTKRIALCGQFVEGLRKLRGRPGSSHSAVHRRPKHRRTTGQIGAGECNIRGRSRGGSAARNSRESPGQESWLKPNLSALPTGPQLRAASGGRKQVAVSASSWQKSDEQFLC